MRSIGTMAAVLVLVGCTADSAAPNDVLPDAADAPWQTDQRVYTLSYQPGLFSVTVRAEYTNKTATAVYLHRVCGYGNEPSHYLIRADDREARVWLGVQSCITGQPRPPIPIGVGETYSQDFTLYSTESPGANPPITMATRTGRFRLIFEVQSTDRVGGWQGVDLLPESERVSNTFAVVPPQKP